jgi:hypothetical protein
MTQNPDARPAYGDGAKAAVTATLHAEARDYQRLCDEARQLGIPVSVDDPDTPQTIDDLRDAVRAEKLRRRAQADVAAYDRSRRAGSRRGRR